MRAGQPRWSRRALRAAGRAPRSRGSRGSAGGRGPTARGHPGCRAARRAARWPPAGGARRGPTRRRAGPRSPSRPQRVAAATLPSMSVPPYDVTSSRPRARRSCGGRPSRERKPCMCAAGALRGAPASTTATVRRARARTSAAERPAAPPPITTTSYLVHALTVLPACGSDNKGCCFRETGGRMRSWTRRGDGVSARPGRSAAQAAPVAARCHADRARGGDRHLEEHAVAAGDRPAPPEPGAAPPARPGLPGGAGRPGRRS